MSEAVKMEGIRDHDEGDPVELYLDPKTGRETIIAYADGGYDLTKVDLLDVIAWLRANRPELLKE